MSTTLEIFTDGSCQGNPGVAAIGVVLREKGKTIKKISRILGRTTNNFAEYSALIYALQEALILRADHVCLNTDSELVYNQLRGEYKIKDANLKFLFDQVQHLAQGFQSLAIKHIPRTQNKEADRLATEAIKKEQAKMVAPMFTMGEESPSSAG